jgi:predicted ester cyclase
VAASRWAAAPRSSLAREAFIDAPPARPLGRASYANDMHHAGEMLRRRAIRGYTGTMTTTIDDARIDELSTPAQREWNKDRVREIIDRIFVHQEDAAIDDLISPDFVPHTFGPMPPGREGLREGMKRAGAGVSEPEFTIHDMIAERDRVAVRLTTSARHTGTFMGIEPTGNRYSIDEMHIFRLQDGMLVEHWHEFDKAALMAQLKGEAPR